jgi:hydrogenase expression/formation protein HypC
MCMSRLHRVIGIPEAGSADVEDVDGTVHRVSLFALGGTDPEPGDWLVVHSGYALDRVEEAEAESVVAELRALLGVVDAGERGGSGS